MFEYYFIKQVKHSPEILYMLFISLARPSKIIVSNNFVLLQSLQALSCMIYVFFKIKSRSQLDTSPLPAPFGQLITMFSPIYPSIISPSRPHCHRPHLSHLHCHHPSLSARHVFPGFCKDPPECTFPLILLQFIFISKSYFLCESHHVTPFLKVSTLFPLL